MELLVGRVEDGGLGSHVGQTRTSGVWTLQRLAYGSSDEFKEE